MQNAYIGKAAEQPERGCADRRARAAGFRNIQGEQGETRAFPALRRT